MDGELKLFNKNLVEIPAAPPAEAFAPATDLKSEDHDDLPF